MDLYNRVDPCNEDLREVLAVHNVSVWSGCLVYYLIPSPYLTCGCPPLLTSGADAVCNINL